MGFLSIKSIIPVGTVFSFAGTTAPEGWIMCDGRSLNRNDYPELFAVLGYSHGGNLTSTFNLPDYRGRFLRGSDNMGTSQGAANRDPDSSNRESMNANGNLGNQVGSTQGDGTIDHEHYFFTKQDDGRNFDGFPINGNLGFMKDNGSQAGYQPASFAGTGVGSVATDNNAINRTRIKAEVRPINAYVNYIIKI